MKRLYSTVLLILLCLFCTACGSSEPDSKDFTIVSNTDKGEYMRLSCESHEKVEYEDHAEYKIITKTANVSFVNEAGEVLGSYGMVSPMVGVPSGTISYYCDSEIELKFYKYNDEKAIGFMGVPIDDEKKCIVTIYYRNGDDFCPIANLFPVVKSVESISFSGGNKLEYYDVDEESDCAYTLEFEQFTAAPIK